MPKSDQANRPPTVALHYAADVASMVALLAEALEQACPEARTVVLLREGNELIPVHVSGEEEVPVGTVVALSGSLGERLRTGAPLSVADYRGDVVRALGGHRIVPCMGRQGVQAAVVSDASEKEKAYWSLLREMAPHVGLVHERLLAPAVFRPSPPGAAPRVRLLELSLRFGGLATLSQTATVVAEALQEALEASSCVLYLHDAGSQSLRFRPRALKFFISSTSRIPRRSGTPSSNGSTQGCVHRRARATSRLRPPRCAGASAPTPPTTTSPRPSWRLASVRTAATRRC